MRSDAIPVIAPIGVGWEGETFNVNADTAAGAIATATGAKRLLLLTDVAGVLDKDKNLIGELAVEDLPGLIANGTITGGMIPKVESAAAVVESGVEGVIILDGRVPHSVLLELLTPHGVGTRISRAGA
jgi:acetylglutamate kinase